MADNSKVTNVSGSVYTFSYPYKNTLVNNASVVLPGSVIEVTENLGGSSAIFGVLTVVAALASEKPNTSYLYSFPTSVESWNFGDKIRADHALNAGTQLLNGDLMIVSGKSDIFNPNPNQLVEIFSNLSRSWGYGTPYPGAGRYFPLIATLPSGRVLVGGGKDGTPFSQEINSVFFADCYEYDPVFKTWERVGDLPRQIFFPTKSWSLLPNGKLLAVGGIDRVTNTIGVTPTPFAASNKAYLYTPSTKTWAYAADMNHARTRARVIAMANGDVLVIGGQLHIPALDSVPTVERYSHTAETFVSYDMPSIDGEDLAGPGYPSSPRPGGRTQSSATLLSNGNILICGGYHQIETSAGHFVGFVRRSTIIFSKSTNTFVATRGPLESDISVNMAIARGDQSALRRQDGLVLLCSGLDHNFLPTTACESYDELSDSFTPTTPMPAKKLEASTRTPLSYLCGTETDNTAEVLSNGDIVLYANESTNFANGNRLTLIFRTGIPNAVAIVQPAIDDTVKTAQLAILGSYMM